MVLVYRAERSFTCVVRSCLPLAVADHRHRRTRTRELFFPMEIQLENCPALVVALVMDVHVDVLVVNENIHHFCNCITVLCTLMRYAANRPRTLMFECLGRRIELVWRLKFYSRIDKIGKLSYFIGTGKTWSFWSVNVLNRKRNLEIDDRNLVGSTAAGLPIVAGCIVDVVGGTNLIWCKPA